MPMLDRTFPALNNASINPPSRQCELCSRVNQPMCWFNLASTDSNSSKDTEAQAEQACRAPRVFAVAMRHHCPC